MKTKRNIIQNYILWLFLIPFFILSIPNNGFAASTGTTHLFRQWGMARVVSDGDYISSQLKTYYSYFIEVPAGLSRLRVQIYDKDIGNTTGGNDINAGTSTTGTCTYTLYDPSGNSWSIGSAGGGNGVWTTLHDTTTTPAGHWEIRVTMSNHDDLNGYGISADDGDNTAGGTELPIYAYSFVPLGTVNTTSNTTTLYPFVTSGCEVDWNDFDGDNTTTTYARFSYASRAGLVPTTTYNGSANNVWVNRAITGFRTDLLNADMGIWTMTAFYDHLSGSDGNFGTFYVGNSVALDPPPTTQPTTTAFRIYLPTDGGGAPAKPVISQKISFISGSNPPVTGSTTRVRVEIIVFNPAAQAITFSASNLVTAYVPGNGVVYAGNPVASQGTVTAPGIGSTGTISWNPGTVAGGNTYATLYYEVNVTPVNGTRLPVTGNPASNGTTARYVDETGNTSQAAATYTYGPLCELAVTPGGSTIPTWVAVSCFEACAEESQPTVEWHTASEVGTVGFNLWRQDKESKEFQLINPNFLPSLPDSPQGGVYRLADPGAQYGEPVVYRLEEIDALGRTMSYGPFTVTFGADSRLQEADALREKIGKEEPSDVYGYRRFNRERSAYELDRLKTRSLSRQAVTASAASASKERVRITVKGRGLFYVNSSQVANSLGVSISQVELLITQHRLNLASSGKTIAWLADSNGAGIFFYNDRVETTYTDQNVFWLEQGSGLGMEGISAGNAGPADAGQSFRETIHFEENHYALTALFSNPKDDFWLWDYVEGGGSAKSFPVIVPGAMSSGPATLTVNLKGATDTAAANDHHATVSLNGTEIGSTFWDGTKGRTFEISFNSSLLNEGANTISVSGALDMGAPYSTFYVESFDLSYQRQYKAYGNTLICRGDGNAAITVAGFTSPQVIILDVSKPDRPKQVTGAALDVSGRITFVPRAAANNYMVIALDAALRPLSLKGDVPARLDKPGFSAEYVVITPEEFRNTAQKLADYRKSKGLTTMVATLEDIYESFNFGLASPLAIRDFLANAYSNWSGKKPKYAVLIGKGTYDYKDYLGFGDNLFPVILAKTSQGLFAADKEFGDVTGNYGIPEIAIGRLPVISNAELQSMIDKIKAYENSQGSWTDKALMIADNTDDAGDFAAGCDDLAALTGGYQAQKIYLADPAQAGETRSRIITAFNSGAALVNYCGHAGLEQLATENIFNVTDAARLQNGSQLPLMVMLTCVAGRFEIPGFTSLGEALLLNEDGGSAGGLIPSGAALHSQSLRLGEEFYKVAFRGKGLSAGLALVQAMKNYIQHGGVSSLLNIYNWLGDPALMFK